MRWMEPQQKMVVDKRRGTKNRPNLHKRNSGDKKKERKRGSNQHNETVGYVDCMRIKWAEVRKTKREGRKKDQTLSEMQRKSKEQSMMSCKLD